MWPARSRPAIAAPAARPHPPKASIWSKSATPRAETPSAKEFDLRLAEPEEIRRCGRNRPVYGEDRDVELVAGGNRIASTRRGGMLKPWIVKGLGRPAARGSSPLTQTSA